MSKIHNELYNLLIECCHHTPDTEKLERFAKSIDDWKGFLTSAYAHGVFPLVHKSLKTIAAVPDEIKVRLKSWNLDIVRRNMSMTSELLHVVKLLEENSVPVLAIKGPILSQIIYGDITQRQYADIDVLIPKHEIYRAGKLLSNAGYTSEHSIEFLKNDTLLKVAKDFSIFNPMQNIHIEFHWQLFLERQVKKSKITLFDPSNPRVQIHGQEIQTLGEDENLIYLLLHGSKHMWERLEWIVDIDRLLRQREGKIDWDRLNAIAHDMEIEVMFYLGLAMSHDLFDTPLESSIVAKMSEREKVLTAKSFIIDELMRDTIHTEQTKAVAFKNLYKMGLNKESALAVIRHYFASLFQLKDLDVYMVNLPNSVSFFYHFIRIYRMIRFYMLGQR